MIREGTPVKWKWGQGTATGTVKETYDHTVTKTLDGAEVTRHGESGDLALLIAQEDGSEVLKLSHEVDRLNE